MNDTSLGLVSLRGNQKPDGINYQSRGLNCPAQTLTSQSNLYKWQTVTELQRGLAIAEATLLQSYPSQFMFIGSKTKQFLQVGNAVPPLLAETVLEALYG